MRFRGFWLTILALEFFLCFRIVFGQNVPTEPLRPLVPHIDQENFKLTPSGRQYMLVINLPDGSLRTENVELRAPNTPEQELHVMGEITNLYPQGSLVTTFEAGKNGYTAKYKYHKTEYGVFYLSANALKSAAG